MFEDIAGKVAIVTGAARGIGRELAAGFGAAGASVVVADLLEEQGEQTVAELREDGIPAAFVKVDVTDPTSTVAMAQHAVDAFGRIDVLVNNAGLWGGLPPATIFEVTPERWDKVFAVNVKGVWLCTVAVAPHMKAGGGGTIINQASIGAYLATPYTPDYSPSKASVITLTKILAKTLADDGIRVNAIAPGGIATEATLEKAPDEVFDATVGRQCIKRRGTPTDLVGPTLFLASEASGFMAGQVLVVDGGLEMRA